MAIDANHEIDVGRLTKDTRKASKRFFDDFYQPATFRNFIIVAMVLQVVAPALWPLWAVAVLWATSSFQSRKFRMPLRYPKDVNAKDPTEYREELVESSSFWGMFRSTRLIRSWALAGGIMYMGYLRSQAEHDQGRELWLSNSDARTHLFLAATTGAGKSEAILSMIFNALCWGSGACAADGKGSNALPFSVLSMCRRMGVEDNFLMLNYLSGGIDPFKAMVERERGLMAESAILAQTNSFNPFGEGAADFLVQLMSSLLVRATGDGAQWQLKAINLMDALLRTLKYKSARGELEISIAEIRHYLALQNLVKLYIEGREGKLPEIAYLPIKSYFETGLPGFNPALADDPNRWDPEVYNQHGYLTGQFSRILSMMMDTYGYVFNDRYPEIDMMDVLLNNRILVVTIPSMEKSAQEAAALGKLYVSSIRLMMAQNLGYQIEGTKADVLDSKATNSMTPYVIVNDEIAGYFAEGIATMFAQARELGFMMVASAQDVQGLKRGEAGEEAASMIANTKVKWFMALEDPEDTYDLVRKAAGEAYVSMLSGYDSKIGTFANSYTAQTGAGIERRERISLMDLKRLNQGEGYIIFKDAVVPCNSFFIPDSHKKSSALSMRLNRFLQVERPAFKRLPQSAVKLPGSDTTGSAFIGAQLRRSEQPYYPVLDDAILDALISTASHVDAITKFSTGPIDRGIVLFEAARKALRTCQESGPAAPWHQARYVDPVELVPDEDQEDVPDEVYEQ